MDRPMPKLPLPKEYFFKGQTFHFLILSLLVVALAYFLDWAQLSQVSFVGISGTFWVIGAIVVAPLHQIYVWVIWRSELVYQNISPLFGGRGFQIYTRIFGLFLLVRFGLLLIIGVVDYGSIQLHPIIVWVISPVIVILAIYTLYSVHRYFGIERAVGGDHFFQKYRENLVKEGIFKYVSNAMYTYGFLGIFLVGIWFSSKAALLLAAFQYIALWTHYFCTEKPDIEAIYTSQ